jgi:hypothetical protein
LSARAGRPERRAALAVAAVHVAVSLGHVLLSGVKMAENRWFVWDAFWQVLPRDLLEEDLGRVLLNLHMQPPLWNLAGALLHRLAGDEFHAVLHALQIGLGAAICVLAQRAVLVVTGRPRLALAVGLLLALDPALVLFEAYALYPIAVAFLATAFVALAARFERTRSAGALLGVVALANALVLTRGLYHPALLVPVVAFAVVLAPGARRRFATLALLVCLPTALWLVKNELRFGFVGTSSWFGQNLWRSVSSNWERAELAELAARGVVAPVTAELSAFLPPSSFREHGFDRVAGVPELDGDHYNNVNEIEISRVYGESARRLFRHDPLRGSRGAARGVLLYTRPASRYFQLRLNRERIALHDRLYSGRLLGDDWLRIPGDLGASGPVFAVLLVATAAAGVRRARREASALGAGAVAWARANPTIVLAAGIAGWNLVVGCLFDFGENERFKFEVQALWWLLAAWALGKSGPISSAD